MTITLIEKELKYILLSPKFYTIFAICSISIVLSIFLGIEDYKNAMIYHDASTTRSTQAMMDETVWMNLTPTLTRYPDPLQIFVYGIDKDIGRQAGIISSGITDLHSSYYSNNPIFTVFRSMDLMFIVQIVLSLFAILFTYDTISGEREKGTLKQSLSNPVPRTVYIISKIIGSLLGLVIPLLIPLLLGIALVLLNNIPMTATHWKQFLLLVGLSVLYFSFFICLGVFVSSLTRYSSASFLYLLVIWVWLVLIMPRAGIMIAGHYVKVPTAVEISMQLSQKTNEIFAEYDDTSNSLSNEFTADLEALKREKISSEKDLAKRKREVLDELMKKLNVERGRRDEKIADYDALLKEDYRHKKATLEKLGFSLSRFSPASAYQLAAMDLAVTSISLKTNYEDQLRTYSGLFNTFRMKKIDASGGLGYSNPLAVNRPEPLDLSEMPKFKFINPELSEIVQFTVIDIALITFFILISIAGTFIAFNRYDVR